MTKSYPMLTHYQFAINTPILATDIDGLGQIIRSFFLKMKTMNGKPAMEVSGSVEIKYKVINISSHLTPNLSGSVDYDASKHFTSKENSISINNSPHYPDDFVRKGGFGEIIAVSNFKINVAIDNSTLEKVNDIDYVVILADHAYDDRGREVAGIADNLGKNFVINYSLHIDQSNDELDYEYLKNTIIHEMAHKIGGLIDLYNTSNFSRSNCDSDNLMYGNGGYKLDPSQHMSIKSLIIHDTSFVCKNLSGNSLREDNTKERVDYRLNNSTTKDEK